MASIYYSAKRDYIVTENENKEIMNIVSKYIRNFSYKDIGEDFRIYEYNPDEADCILEGATKLPYTDDVQTQWDACLYWMECLTAITRILSDAKWEASMDGVPFIWEEADGWRVLTDAEYEQQCGNQDFLSSFWNKHKFIKLL